MINDMEEAKLELTANHYECVLRACDRKERWQESLALLTRMREAGLRPSATAIECVLRCCAKGMQTDMVVAVWELMRTEIAHLTEPLRPTIRTYNTLMGALTGGVGNTQPDAERKKGAAAVLNAFDEARAARLLFEDTTYRHAFRACDLLGKSDRALDLLMEYRADGFIPDVLTYSNVMSACARAGRVDNAIQLMREMREEGLQPNAFCYNSAMVAATKANRLSQALQLMQEMEKDAGVAPTKHT
jgi:pentatricopeptide repeat domain-containing protein 1